MAWMEAVKRELRVVTQNIEGTVGRVERCCRVVAAPEPEFVQRPRAAGAVRSEEVELSLLTDVEQ